MKLLLQNSLPHIYTYLYVAEWIHFKQWTSWKILVYQAGLQRKATAG